MDATEPYTFIPFGAMDVSKPYKCIGPWMSPNAINSYALKPCMSPLSDPKHNYTPSNSAATELMLLTTLHEHTFNTVPEERLQRRRQRANDPKTPAPKTHHRCADRMLSGT
jgi:hypothetical protein